MSAHQLLIAQDTTAKRTAIEQTVSVSIPIPNTTTAQELTELIPLNEDRTRFIEVPYLLFSK